MAFFTDAQLASISIDKMVFHLVGPKPENLVKLQEVDPGRFAKFFIERIRSVNFGTPYVFSDASATRERMRRILEDGKTFQEESEKLADEFQQLHGGSAAGGALLVFLLDTAGEKSVALLKYDDETVLAYEVEDHGAGKKTVSLAALEKTFVQNKDALQKSALIRLTDEGGTLTVLDRRNQQKIARYFENFLGAKREFDDAELTVKLVEATRRVIKENQDLVPPEVYRQMMKRTLDAAKGGGDVDAEDQKSFLETVIGQKLPDDSPLVDEYRKALHVARIDGMPLKLNSEKVTSPKSYRYRTEKGIEIRVPVGLEGLIETADGRIIIRDRVEQVFDDPK